MCYANRAGETGAKGAHPHPLEDGDRCGTTSDEGSAAADGLRRRRC